jgi:predicted RNA-binding protein with PIN domain
MTSRLIVDGNNVIGSRPDGWWRDRPGATRRLVEQLGMWAAQAREDVIVVFDGRRPEGLMSVPAVEVRFAARRTRNAADDVIAALVAAAVSPAELTVVTSDVALATRVRGHGAKVTGSGGFRDRLEQLGR